MNCSADQVEALDHAPHQARAEEAGDAADERTHHVVRGHAVEPQLEPDDDERDGYAERGSDDAGWPGSGS